MSSPQNRNKRVVWQDIVPASQVMRSPAKKPRKKLIPAAALVVKKINRKLIGAKRRLRIVLAALLIIVTTVVAVGVTHLGQLVKPPTTGSNTQSVIKKPTDSLVPGTPSYAVLLPAGKTIKDLGGGWVRDQSHPLFVYIDKISTTQINVSEQPLSADLKADTENEVESIAQSYNITEKITVGSIVIHIGTFDKGVQRIILSKANLLILITSNSLLTNDQWIAYINSLN